MGEFIMSEILPIGYCIFVGLMIIVVPFAVFQPKFVNEKLTIGIFTTWCIIGLLISITAVAGMLMCI